MERGRRWWRLNNIKYTHAPIHDKQFERLFSTIYHINAVITPKFELTTMPNNYIPIHLLLVSEFDNNDSSENFYDFSNIDIESKCDKENFLLNLIFR